MIHERDRRTERRTDGHRMTAIAALMHSIARQKVYVEQEDSAQTERVVW